MNRIGTILVTGILGLVLLMGNFSGSATAQKETQFKPKLPNYWTQLGLSVEQKSKVYKIQEDFHVKKEDLKKQMKKLEAEEKDAMVKVLSDNQKQQLRKIYLDKIGVDPFAPSKSDDPKQDQP